MHVANLESLTTLVHDAIACTQEARLRGRQRVEQSLRTGLAGPQARVAQLHSTQGSWLRQAKAPGLQAARQ